MYVYIYSPIHTEMYGNKKFKNIITKKLTREAKENKMKLWIEKKKCRKEKFKVS